MDLRDRFTEMREMDLQVQSTYRSPHTGDTVNAPLTHPYTALGISSVTRANSGSLLTGTFLHGTPVLQSKLSLPVTSSRTTLRTQRV